MFLSLNLEELVQESLMKSVPFTKIVEDVSDERFQTVAWDDGWIHRA
jgi:hypothetical protein